MYKLTALAALTVTIATGCVDMDTDPTEETSSYALTLPAASAQQILDLVNYPGTDLHVLDASVALDSRAAANILTRRNGVDGVTPSPDDYFFETIEQLDAVPLVGDSAFGKLAAYAAAHPAPASELVEGVAFHGWEAEAVVWGVNQASVAELDAMLDDRAAASLAAKRPFTSLAQMAPLAYVGSSAFSSLLVGAPRWWNQKGGGTASLAGRFDGAVFNEVEAEIALAIVNQATKPQLTAHGITATPAGVIIAARPYSSLAQVAALSGIGSSTMNALLAYAQSGQWGVASSAATFTSAVAPHLADLLFLSESDRPIELVSFAGAGGSAPTAASLLALLHAPAGSWTEMRSVSNYFVAFEPSRADADPDAGTAVEAAVTGQLTNVIYVAVHQPPGSVDRSLVDVYLVGLTSTGDLVGLHAVSVET